MPCTFPETLSASARHKIKNKNLARSELIWASQGCQGSGVLSISHATGFSFLGVSRNTSAAHDRVPKRFSLRFKTPTSSGANKRLRSIYFTKRKHPSDERVARLVFTPRRRLLSSALGALTALTAHVSMFIVGNSRENTRQETTLPILSHQRGAGDKSDYRRNASTNRRHDQVPLSGHVDLNLRATLSGLTSSYLPSSADGRTLAV